MVRLLSVDVSCTGRGLTVTAAGFYGEADCVMGTGEGGGGMDKQVMVVLGYDSGAVSGGIEGNSIFALMLCVWLSGSHWQ